MTLPQLAQTATTQALRDVSQTVFGRPHQLEIAAAIAGIQGGFEIDDLHREAQDAASSAGLDRPSRSATQKNLAKLVAAGAVNELPPPRPGVPGYYSAAAASAFWAFALELCREP
jgi:hypothetical protein